MNQYNRHPLMSILKSDPGKYLDTPSATLAALIAAAEGFPALLGCFRLCELLLALLRGRSSPLLPTAFFINSAVNKAIFALGVFCVLVMLLCVCLDAGAALLLRFAHRGASVLRGAQLGLFAASCGLLALFLCLCASEISGYVRAGMRFAADETLKTGFLGELPALMDLPRLGTDALPEVAVQMVGRIRGTEGLCVLIAAAAVSVLLFALRASYHRGLSEAMRVVDFELRLGFKEMDFGAVRLARDSFAFGFLFLAAALLYGIETLPGGFTRGSALRLIALTALAVKYFAVYKSWQNFKGCHR